MTSVIVWRSYLCTKRVSDVNAADIIADEVMPQPVGNAELHRHSIAIEDRLCILQVAEGDAEGGQEFIEHDLLELGNYDVSDELKLVIYRALAKILVLLHDVAEAVVLSQPDNVLGSEEGVL